LALGFATATKYRLRRKLGYEYPDLVPYIQNISTLAQKAYLADGPLSEQPWSSIRRVCVDLDLPGALPDPCKGTERGLKYHGNLPYEILVYISAYVDIVISAGGLPSIPVQIQVMNALASFTDCLSGMERILHTPLPLAYRIAISQISWIYILALPFQLVTYLGWVAIPGTLGNYGSFKMALIYQPPQ
jgi:ion channel-forming bestrophin family protein